MPVVVLESTLLDALTRDADLLPEVDRLLVSVEGCHPDLVTVESETALGLGLGDQFPGHLDGALLEVVTEREVAEHLEEGAVAGGLADLLDVEGTHALLCRDGPAVGGLLVAHEVGLERHHAGVDEEQRRIVVEQRRAGDHFVIVAREMLQERVADVRCLHSSFSRRLCSRMSSASRSAMWWRNVAVKSPKSAAA